MKMQCINVFKNAREWKKWGKNAISCYFDRNFYLFLVPSVKREISYHTHKSHKCWLESQSPINVSMITQNVYGNSHRALGLATMGSLPFRTKSIELLWYFEKQWPPKEVALLGGVALVE